MQRISNRRPLSKVTVPQPFQMTIREEGKAVRRKQLNAQKKQDFTQVQHLPQTLNGRPSLYKVIEKNRRRSRSDSEVPISCQSSSIWCSTPIRPEYKAASIWDLPDLSPLESVAYHRVGGQLAPSVKQSAQVTMRKKFLANGAHDVVDEMHDDGRRKVSSVYATSEFPAPKTTLTALLRESANRKRVQEEQRRKENQFGRDLNKHKDSVDLRSAAVTLKASNVLQNRRCYTTEKDSTFNKADKECACKTPSMLKHGKNCQPLIEFQSQLSVRVESQSLSIKTDDCNISTRERIRDVDHHVLARKDLELVRTAGKEEEKAVIDQSGTSMCHHCN